MVVDRRELKDLVTRVLKFGVPVRTTRLAAAAVSAPFGI
jgi:hypothetical protein